MDEGLSRQGLSVRLFKREWGVLVDQVPADLDVVRRGGCRSPRSFGPRALQHDVAQRPLPDFAGGGARQSVQQPEKFR